MSTSDTSPPRVQAALRELVSELERLRDALTLLSLELEDCATTATLRAGAPGSEELHLAWRQVLAKATVR